MTPMPETWYDVFRNEVRKKGMRMVSLVVKSKGGRTVSLAFKDEARAKRYARVLVARGHKVVRIVRNS